MSAFNGDRPAGPLDVGEVLRLQMRDGSTFAFEVRAILEDGETKVSYAVLERDVEGEDGELIVTDLEGNLIEDADRVEEVLENYLLFSEEAGDDGSEVP